ncbi:Glycosyl transferase, family 4, conserved region-containing protein [[Leptolyngbya] sp. PCC 7376]|uniref:glycosyltransferase family 4 protein n=1 Tax=[Leptolyngbya] sp. PCC 7376 TaxID=111781 RepID=UPI00029EDD40|nr:MraY family glycosyltransferase [[Leptolyngbya] sp. PCC 7376]AFY39568.1 Glycosyl transferase, family 4, conserved region-containing protein [[Leptolyngbya] sp. PCC 7376]
MTAYEPMPTEFLYPSIFLVSLTIVLVLTPIVKSLGLKNGLFDQPDERKVHSQPMVRLGGIAIFLGTMTAIAGGLWQSGFEITEGGSLLALLCGAIAFFAFGLLDDVFELSAISRLILQFFVAAIAWYFGVRIDYLALPFVGAFSVGLLSLPFTLIWLVGMVNAINWIDGLDGLAAGVTSITSILLFVVMVVVGQPAVAIVAIALAGAAVGFLRYNFNPAQLFMGDGGSNFIGFILSGLAIFGLSGEPKATAVMLPYIILLVPLIDMTVVVFTRLGDGVSPFKPDKRHLHHKLLKAGFSQRTAVVFIYALTLWSGSFALAIAGLSQGLIVVAVSSGLLGMIGWQFWRVRDIPNPQK